MHRLVLLLLGTWTTAAADEPEPPDLAGTYHLRMRTATVAKIPVIGSLIVHTTTDLLATVEHKGGQFIQTHRTCAVKSIPTRGITRTTLPPSFIQALPTKTYPVRLTADVEGWRYDADLKPQAIGYHPQHSDSIMPEEPDHPSIFDWDQDGQPGASVMVDIPVLGSFRVFMVQYSHAQLTGRVESRDRVTGQTVMVRLDYQTIGADNVLFSRSPSVEPTSGHSKFEMTRIPDGSTCAQVVGD